MMALEGAEDARATATGMAAVTAAMLSLLQAGDHVVAARALFGSCRYIVETLLPRYGIETTMVDGRDTDAWEQAMRPTTKVMFLETPSNPVLEVIDMQAVADIAHAHGARLVVDNVFATPILQRPLDFGADIVVYSATKHIDGQGRCLGGIIWEMRLMCATNWPISCAKQARRSPFNAWVMLKSLETLSVRVDAHCDNAEKLVDFLNAHDKVGRVIYPGDKTHPQYDLATRQMTRGGNLIAFDVGADKADAFRFANNLHIAAISNNLGDAKTLITHPATTTHFRLDDAAKAELGIRPTSLRVSIGLEDPADLVEDFERALDRFSRRQN